MTKLICCQSSILLLISVLLAGIGALLLGRALRRDLARYSLVPTDEERADEREETGWKQVHGDVFRPPSRMPFLFSIVVGVSCQVLGMTFVVLCFAAIGFLSPANRGSLIIAMVVLFLTMGVLAGYQSARTHKMFNGQQWQRITFATAIGFPAFVFLILFVLNLFVWSAGSVNAVDFGSMFAVVALWLLVSVPLVFVGAYYGFKREKVDFPCAVAPVPRPVPEQEWYMHPLITMAVGGALPFGAAFVEVYFILTSIWLDQYYYVFGFLLLTFIIVIVTCMEVSIVHTYLQVSMLFCSHFLILSPTLFSSSLARTITGGGDLSLFPVLLDSTSSCIQCFTISLSWTSIMQRQLSVTLVTCSLSLCSSLCSRVQQGILLLSCS